LVREAYVRRFISNSMGAQAAKWEYRFESPNVAVVCLTGQVLPGCSHLTDGLRNPKGVPP
jgi:hypothetical protein